MRNIAEVSSTLLVRLRGVAYPKGKLASDAGITHRTLSHVLSGEQDFKISTLIAVADRLDLEVALVPKSKAIAEPYIAK
jgi:DNA-binding phage protein